MLVSLPEHLRTPVAPSEQIAGAGPVPLDGSEPRAGPAAPAGLVALDGPGPPLQPSPRAPDFGLAAARRELRRQLAVLERTWAGLLVEWPAGVAPAAPPPSAGSNRRPFAGGRLLSLAALESRRDGLIAAIDRARTLARAEHDRQAAARRRLEAMVADPCRHRFERVSNEELGRGGCGVYQVRPRLGLIGMLAGWWEVKLSSGCP